MADHQRILRAVNLFHPLASFEDRLDIQATSLLVRLGGSNEHTSLTAA